MAAEEVTEMPSQKIMSDQTIQTPKITKRGTKSARVRGLRGIAKNKRARLKLTTGGSPLSMRSGEAF
jgi:hypothetical protein